MQEIRELLRQREQQCERLQKEIDALRTTLGILEAEELKSNRISESAAGSNGSGMFVAATQKQFP